MTKKLKIFLSHDSRDFELAKVISTVMARLSLQQLEVWYSSDKSAEGGIGFGAWLDTVREKLNESRAIVVLITKRSMNRPWLLFESGFGAASEKCEVIPVCVGVSPSAVPFPLGMYQIFQLSDYNSLREFIEKL